MNNLYEYDKSYKERVIGVDEAGRGPLAGPVVASAVVIDRYIEDFDLINDSKKLSEKRRNILFDSILANCQVGIGIATEEEIDNINILNATFLAMRRAIEDLQLEPDRDNLVLVDGNYCIRGYEGSQKAIIKGDGTSLAIAAASIVAKVTRDEIMIRYDNEYEGYGFAKHKGYGTKEHREAILEKGPCKAHRRSFLTKILAKTLF